MKSIIAGAAAMTAIIVGMWMPPEPQRWIFLSGAAVMTGVAVAGRHKLFVGFQLVVLCGTLAAFAALPPAGKAAVPVLGAVPVVLWLFHAGVLKNAANVMGAAALALLAIGYATQHPMGFFLGGGLVTAFSLVEFRRGFKPAIIWALLNAMFTASAAWQLLS